MIFRVLSLKIMTGQDGKYFRNLRVNSEAVFGIKEQIKFWPLQIRLPHREFYAKINNEFFIDSDLVRLSQTIKNNGSSLQPDITSLYQLLAIGNLLEDRTPIQNIHKILDSEIVEINCDSLNFKKIEYFDVNNIPYYNQSQNQAIDQIHEIFTEGVKWNMRKILN